MKKLATIATAWMATAHVAIASDVPGPGSGTGGSGGGADVPEISALEGTAALAVLAAVVLLVWERRRRAA